MVDLYAHERSVAKAIALESGAIMLAHFNEPVVERKSDDSPVTTADTAINALVIREISKEFDDGIVGEEESTATYGMGRKWICDPIDGTRAFVWGVPTAMFSLALVIDGVPVVGVAYDPFLNLLYEAVSGGGSFLNGEKIRVSSREIEGAHVGVSSSLERIIKNPVQTALVQNLLDKKARLVCFSGAVYKGGLLARGKIEGYIEKNLNPHDVAAIDVIVKEAGGTVTDFNGKPLDYTKHFKGAILSNTVTHAELLACIPGIE